MTNPNVRDLVDEIINGTLRGGYSREAVQPLAQAFLASESECMEQARINGQGMERELDLLAMVAALEKTVGLLGGMAGAPIPEGDRLRNIAKTASKALATLPTPRAIDKDARIAKWPGFPQNTPTILHKDIGCSVPLLFSTQDSTGRYIRLGYYADNDLRNGFIESGDNDKRVWLDEVDCFYEYPFPPRAALVPRSAEEKGE